MLKAVTIASAMLCCLAADGFAQGQSRVDGYTRRDGVYVQPHMRTNPDSNQYNNWSTRGNSNPYTGQPGTVTPNPYGGQNYMNTQPYQSYGTQQRRY